MKKIIASYSMIAYLALSLFYGNPVYGQTERIQAEENAKQLAAQAEGKYVEGEAEPAVQEGEVALPILDESTGEVLGYIVADRAKLISVLNEAGLTKVADALAAAEAGAEAGETVKSGIFGGTTTWIILGVAAVAGLALGLGGGGGGGGGGGDSSTPVSRH